MLRLEEVPRHARQAEFEQLFCLGPKELLLKTYSASHQQSLGKSTNEAVQVLFERMPLPEVNFFVVVITVQAQAGGNLSEALSNLSRVLRNRKKMKQKIKAMSSEAKASAGIIGSLPFIVSILVTLTTPTYLLPLFTTTTGQIWLGIASFLMFIGGFIMNRMIQFDF